MLPSSLNRVCRHGIHCHFGQDGVRIAMPGQPFLGIRTMAGEIDKLGIIAGTVKNKDRAGGGPFLTANLRSLFTENVW